ncbi:hypothetical protein TVAG_437290 [Trichomonas vaginalis G3]|uniref:Uncharacterized protein n=1 Tax=Trichomonas vaginalis (strain ATCC PRA-98 / G3) TaxID=412133 RepID=A2DFH5_TRIV3|nr:guanine nucleotide exchange c9orf72 family [Trichomonas vaginalis G3]EAY20903.1 hypothetical protein TVAG_437290 [Trichomonas vaginalis G3]KAI5521486.1 guanine nucleotide exchange c9orf72 family [Trichomonas vaginalis G3]|eukprot:XP_001581889.1 hypothetical protein [Trichomonas vaginalis G3]
MLQHVVLNFPEDHPFLGMGIASYDLLKGIEKIFEWDFLPSKGTVPQSSLYKIVLGNVHRQNDTALNKIIPISLEIHQFNCYLICAIFGIKINEKTIFYIYGLFLQHDKIHNNLDILRPLLKKATDGAMKIKITLQAKQPIHEATHYIQKLANEIKTLMKSGITTNFPIPRILPQDSLFYATALFSHLTSQMVTIIEASSFEEAEPLFSFLSKFLLKSQASLSSTLLLDEPQPELFLQIVKERETISMIKMLNFERSWTWIRLKTKSVYISPDITSQKRYYDIFKDFDPNDNSENGKRMKKYLETYTTRQITRCHWTTTIVSKIISSSPQVSNLICERTVDLLVTKGIVLLEYIKSLGEVAFLQNSQLEIAKQLLEVTEEDMFYAIVSVADLFDNSVHRKIFAGKKAMLMSMMASI